MNGLTRNFLGGIGYYRYKLLKPYKKIPKKVIVTEMAILNEALISGATLKASVMHSRRALRLRCEDIFQHPQGNSLGIVRFHRAGRKKAFEVVRGQTTA